MKKIATEEVVKRVDCILDTLSKVINEEVTMKRSEINALYEEYDQIRETYDLFDQVFEEDGKKGVRNAACKVLVPALYKDFSETYTYRRYGYVMPIPACDFNDKYAIVKCDGNGTPLCGFEYDMIKFMFGSCALYKCWKRVGEKYLTGVLDSEGNVIVPCEMDEIYSISNSFAVVEKDGKFGAVTTNSFYVEPLYDEIEEREGYLTACKDGNWGYISSKGEFIDAADEDRMDEEEMLCLLEY